MWMTLVGLIASVHVSLGACPDPLPPCRQLIEPLTPITIADAPIGMAGYMTPWSIKRTPDGRLWVLGYLSPTRGGTATMPVMKTACGVRLPGYRVSTLSLHARGWVTNILRARPDLVPVVGEDL